MGDTGFSRKKAVSHLWSIFSNSQRETMYYHDVI